jgi:TRAP-type mannitol/chloroaromatic compound transport system substrate-binding protein
MKLGECDRPTQPRELFAKKAVNSPADLDGVKMRVPEIKTYLNLWQTLGTKPARVAWAEVFLGLKTGVIDAAEGPVGSAYAQKFHQAAKYVMRTDHLMSSQHITINDKVYQSLPEDVRKIMVDAAREAIAWGRKAAEAETEDVVRKMAAEGATVVNVNRAPFAEKAVSAANGIARRSASFELFEELVRLLAENVDQHVESTPVRHADHGLEHDMHTEALQSFVQQRDQTLAALKSEAFRTGKPAMQILLKTFGGRESLENHALFRR